ncbi:ThuA domain-containing protein [Vallicoccus soli]|uniref:ThuA domain-containing protein n=1 Tax=Vallicoccus soli TaxID=2339232 RepID=A0A3A3Z5P2_9ACTN|nr:ThuA domain-containing protein [Vallicoccus soli]RJK97028.1 ThuA domain-containing protein [Vallicoccus soli]
MRIRPLLALAAAAACVGVGVAAPATGEAKPQQEKARVLVFSKTAAFRHDSIPAGVRAIERLGRPAGIAVDTTEDAGAFTDRNLRKYDAVVFMSTTGDVLDEPQERAFERYIQRGGGYLGVHAASDTEYDWPWYGGLVGAYFLDHPGAVNEQFQEATVVVEGPRTKATSALPRFWERTEEWYNFRTNPRPYVRVLATVDEDTYDPRGYTGSEGMGDDHPITWCQRYDGGRSVYTGMGHQVEAYSEPMFLRHLSGALKMASGLASTKHCKVSEPRG